MTQPKKIKIQNSGKYDFLSIGKYFAIVSIILVVVSLLDIFVQGFNYGIDFQGGTEVQVLFTGGDVKTEDVRSFVESQGIENPSVQAIGDEEEMVGDEYLIRLNTVEGKDAEETAANIEATVEKLTEGLATAFPGVQADIRRVDTVGPQIGNELKKNALLAMFYSLLLTLIYIGLRFDYKYAPGAIFCLFHDAILVLGIFAFLDVEVNVQTLAAILTVIGYSINDTIVIFDRIRENVAIYRDESFAWICNRSINETLSRTLMTSFTTLLAVATMYFIAGGVIEDFSFALGLGIIFGCYSTVYVAIPLVILMDRIQNAKKTKAA